jgi:hypothetical protein
MVGVQVLAGERFSLLCSHQTGSAAHPVSYQLDTASYLPHIKTTFCFHASISKYSTSFKKQFCHFKNQSCIPPNQKASTSQFLSVCPVHFVLWLEKLVTRLQLDGWGIIFQLLCRGRHFLFSTESKLPLGATIQSLCKSVAQWMTYYTHCSQIASHNYVCANVSSDSSAKWMSYCTHYRSTGTHLDGQCITEVLKASLLIDTYQLMYSWSLT